MFELVKTYICNGCSATADPATAKAWIRLNNSPNDGKQNMDFCPRCAELLQSVMSDTVNVSAKTVQPVITLPQTATAINTVSEAPAWEPVKQTDTENVVAELESEDLSVTDSADTAEPEPITVTEEFINFYNQLYARILYDIACDSTDDSITTYAPFIPGKVSVDKDSPEFGNIVTLKFNNKRLVIIYDTDKPTSAELKVCRGKRVLYTRKVSKFSAVLSFVTDLAQSDMNFLPENAKAYTADYMRAKIDEIDKAILNGIDLHDLKSWIKFIIDQLGIAL